MSLQDGAYGNIYSCQVLFHCKTNVKKQNRGKQSARQSQPEGAGVMGEHRQDTIKTPMGHGAALGFTEQRQVTGFIFPFPL